MTLAILFGFVPALQAQQHSLTIRVNSGPCTLSGTQTIMAAPGSGPQAFTGLTVATNAPPATCTLRVHDNTDATVADIVSGSFTVTAPGPPLQPCMNSSLGNGITCTVFAMGEPTSLSNANTATTPAFTSSGNLEVIAVAGRNNCSVSDSKNPATVALTRFIVNDGVSIGMQLFYVLNPIVGANHTVTVNCTTTGALSYPRVMVAFYQGTGNFAFDQQSGNSFAGVGTTISAGSVTPTSAPALIIGACGASGLSAPGMAGISVLGTFPDTTGVPALYAVETQSQPAAFSTSCTEDFTAGGGATLASFRDVIPAPTPVLTFSQQPTNTVNAMAFTPAVAGNLSNVTTPHVLTMASASGGCTLGGTPTITVTSGWSFPGVTVSNANLPATCTITIIDTTQPGGAASITSATFNVTAAPPVTPVLAFTQEPVNTVSTMTITPSVAGTMTPGSQRSLRMLIATGNCTLSGPTTVNSSASTGNWSFPGVTVTAASPPVNCTIRIHDNSTTAAAADITSNPFTVTPNVVTPMYTLTWVSQPTTTGVGTPMTPTMSVSISPITPVGQPGIPVTITVTTGTCAFSGGSLTQTTTPGESPTTPGLATFTSLVASNVGGGCRLTATAPGANGVESDIFSITPALVQRSPLTLYPVPLKP